MPLLRKYKQDKNSNKTHKSTIGLTCLSLQRELFMVKCIWKNLENPLQTMPKDNLTFYWACVWCFWLIVHYREVWCLRLWFDNICFAGQPMGWALVSPGISPMGRLDGVREPVLSSPSIRLYKYSIYDGKVGKQIILQDLTWPGKKENGVRINAKAFFSFCKCHTFMQRPI